MARILLLCLLTAAACKAVDPAIRNYEFQQNWIKLVMGPDRGLKHYVDMVNDSVERSPHTRWYRYKGKPQFANYKVRVSVRGLASTDVQRPDALAAVVDYLLFVLAQDPIGANRAEAARGLGKVLLRLPLPGYAGEDVPTDPDAGRKINTIARDLLRIEKERTEGKRIKAATVVERLLTMSKLRPVDFGSARQMVRAIASRPISRSAGSVRKAADRLTPRMLRRSILVALRDVTCGDPDLDEQGPDESVFVRVDGALVLARIASPVALGAALERLGDPYDPAERNPDVRGHLLDYLGKVGGPRAFEVCLRRMGDVRYGVRFHAYRALVRMTGAMVPPEPVPWRKWREANPAWLESASPPKPA